MLPIFADAGGWNVARKIFGNIKLQVLFNEFNEVIAA